VWARSEANISQLSVPCKIASICPHPAEPLLALIERRTGKLLILCFDRSLVFEEAATRLPETRTRCQ